MANEPLVRPAISRAGTLEGLVDSPLQKRDVHQKEIYSEALKKKRMCRHRKLAYGWIVWRPYHVLVSLSMGLK